MTSEQRQILSDNMKRRWADGIIKPVPFTLERRRKISEAQKGKKRTPMTAAAKAHLSAIYSGRALRKTPLSEKEKAWTAQMQSLYIHDPETAAKRAASMSIAHKLSPLIAASLRKATSLTTIENRKIKPEDHQSSQWFHVRSPVNLTYHFKNLHEFVRQNQGLFDPDDALWRSSKRAGRSCRATDGLGSLSPRKVHPRLSWKGWTWVSNNEEGGIDLLARNIL